MVESKRGFRPSRPAGQLSGTGQLWEGGFPGPPATEIRGRQELRGQELKGNSCVPNPQTKTQSDRMGSPSLQRGLTQSFSEHAHLSRDTLLHSWGYTGPLGIYCTESSISHTPRPACLLLYL